MDNLTAKVSCFARAFHYRNNSAHIFADPYAGALLGTDYERIAQSMAQGVGYFIPGFSGSAEEGLRLIVDRQLSPSVLGRSAFCERSLANEQRLGCRQYLIFASGYDTFAIRNRDESLTVYELDLPRMLADKQTRVEVASLASRAVYIPCDLSETAWPDRLADRGFMRGSKSFASLLRISYYLDKDAFRAILKTLGGVMPEGSAVCFDYPSSDCGREAQTNRSLAQAAGEPMKAQYTHTEMELLLQECGFLIYEHLDHKEMTGQYFSAYNSRCPAHKMEAPEGVCYALAVRKA